MEAKGKYKNIILRIRILKNLLIRLYSLNLISKNKFSFKNYKL